MNLQQQTDQDMAQGNYFQKNKVGSDRHEIILISRKIKTSINDKFDDYYSNSMYKISEKDEFSFKDKIDDA